jgi:hypothetical protein
MPMTFTATHPRRDRKVPRVSEIEVWRAAAQLRKQFPEAPWLEASHRADRAYAAGHMFHFRLWGRVTHALRGRDGNTRAAA